MEPRGATPPEDDLVRARRALAKGDLVTAAQHAANTVAEDPNRPETLALLDEIIEADSELDANRLAPVTGDEPPHGVLAVHGYILAHQGRTPEALEHLLQAMTARPDVLYIDWALGWLQRPEVAGHLDVGRVAAFLAACVEQFPALRAPHGGGRATLDRLPVFLQFVRRVQPPDAAFLAVSIALLRRLGRLDDALALAKEANTLEPDAQTAVTLASVHEQRGDVEHALAAYKEALRHDPDDAALKLSMAEMLWNNSKAKEAQELYEEVLAREPENERGRAGYYFVRFVHDGDAKWRDQLLDLAESQPQNDLAGRLAKQTSPYVGYLPEPGEMTTNILRAATEKGDSHRLSRLALKGVEAPSNYLAFDQLRRIDVSVARVQTPDPRLPRRRVDYLLWRYEDDRPKVNVPPPDGAVAWAVVEIAGQQYHLENWFKAAARLAGRMEPSKVTDLLATMVYPPRPPQVGRPWAWVYRVQVAAALVIANLDEGWEGSVRRKALISLLHGPMDWTVDAAIVALTALALQDDDAATEVTRLFRELRQELPTDGTVCYQQALLWCSLRLPELPEKERGRIRKQLREWQGTREAEEHFQRGVAAGEQGEYTRGIEELTAAIRDNAEYAEAYQARAGMYLRTGDADKAVADFTRVLELRPDAADAYLGRGRAYMKQARLESALGDLTDAVRLAPEDWQGYYQRGLAHASKHKHQEAIADFTRVIELDGDIAWAYVQRGNSHAERRQYDRAIEDFTSALGLDANLSEAYLFRAVAHAAAGDLDRAIADYTQRIRLSPEYASGYNGRAQLHYRKDNWRAALTDHQKACQLDPGNASTYNYLAWIWATCPEDGVRDGARALENATKACEMTKFKKSYCLDTLAAAHAECGQFEEAMRWAEKALELAPASEKQGYRDRLETYRAGRPYRGKGT